MRAALVIATLAVLTAAWTGSAQVSEKPAANSTAPAKKSPAPPKSADEKGKKSPAPDKGDSETKSKPDGTGAEAADDADIRDIRKGAEAFEAAYNAHDARVLAELFAQKAELVDEDGLLLKGRAAIEKDFAETFREYPQSRITIEPQTVRLLTPNIAVEEGIVRGQPDPAGDENVSTYLAVHVKIEGRWQVVSVRDFAADPENKNASENLDELNWMVGDWIDEQDGSVVKSTCRWDASGNYLLHEYDVKLGGGARFNGSMRIGWDPLTQQIKSWSFDADSSYSEALWGRDGDEWILRSRGVNSDGTATSSTHVFRYVDKDTMTWRVFDRAIGGVPAPDVPEEIIRRQAPPPGE